MSIYFVNRINIEDEIIDQTIPGGYLLCLTKN